MAGGVRRWCGERQRGGSAVVKSLLQIRCSSLPRLAACAAAIDPPEIRIESDRGPADLGTAFHEILASHVSGSTTSLTVDNLQDVAARHCVEVEDLAPLVFWAAKAWSERLAIHFPNPIVERHVRAEDPDAGVALDGHPDVLSYDVRSREVRVLDWKSGRGDDDHRQQLRGYGMLGLIHFPDAIQVRVSILRVRRQKIETETHTRESLNLWWAWLAEQMKDRDTYRPGPHCTFCPRAFTCEARTTALAQASKVLLSDTTLDLSVMSSDQLGEVVLRAKDLKKTVEQILDAAKVQVALHGGSYGPLSLDIQNRRGIDVDRGLDVLVETLGMDRVRPLLKIGKGDVEKAAGETAPRGGKKQAITLLMDRLESVGAITISTVEKLEVDYGSGIGGATAIAGAGGERTG
jgi:hypothetical protein